MYCFYLYHLIIISRFRVLRVLWNLLLPKCVTIALPAHSRWKAASWYWGAVDRWVVFSLRGLFGSLVDFKNAFLCLTGPKVVSKDITVESIEEVTKILRRAPVIWDNIHANDYDQKRLFLGPYKGRSTELIPRLKGVLTNPNCEFESNFVAIHTLATWYKSNMYGVRKDVVMGMYVFMKRLF